MLHTDETHFGDLGLFVMMMADSNVVPFVRK
ncbi:MAG: hypothetical protein JWQ10_94 [Herbaspirillum sp.]|nr:hypothetical protein [Herbaspirillum sp.]